MTKEAFPPFIDFFVPAVHVLRKRGGSATIEELEEHVADAMRLSDEVRAILHGDGPQTQFQYVLGWVRTYLKKAAALDNSSRGVWSLTERGEAMSDDAIGAIVQAVRSESYERRKRAKTGATRAGATAFEVEDGEGWTTRLLNVLGEMSPGAFERLCQRLLRESGFIKVDVTGRSGDGGIDGIGVLRMNLVSFQVLFQCKRWKSSVGAGVVRDFRGAMVGRADKGLIITTASFTPDARREATRDGAPTIDLVDGETLCALLKDLKLGVSVELVEEITVQPEWFQGL